MNCSKMDTLWSKTPSRQKDVNTTSTRCFSGWKVSLWGLMGTIAQLGLNNIYPHTSRGGCIMDIVSNMRSLYGRPERKSSIPISNNTHLRIDLTREDGVIEAFAKLWGTDKLLVSFDGMNFTLPSGTTLPQTQPWPHIDQSPLREGMQCVQGILNFAPNGPQDGGLLVMKGSTKLMPEFFKTHSGTIGRETWGPSDWFGFDEGEVKWFEERGCEIHKVTAEAGDLILWDSRTMHFNCVPSTQNVRAVVCEYSSPIQVVSLSNCHRCMLYTSFLCDR